MASQGFVFIRFGLYALNVTSVSKVEKEKKNTCNWLNTYSVPGISRVVFYLIFTEASSNLEL